MKATTIRRKPAASAMAQDLAVLDRTIHGLRRDIVLSAAKRRLLHDAGANGIDIVNHPARLALDGAGL